MLARTRARRYADTYSSADLATRAGVSYRQVDHWVRQGLLHTVDPVEGSGTVRRFRPVEVEVARAVVALRAMGIGGGMGKDATRGADLVRRVAEAVRRRRARFTREGVTGRRTRLEVGGVTITISDESVTLCALYDHADRHA
jgi:hypothetical protein